MSLQTCPATRRNAPKAVAELPGLVAICIATYRRNPLLKMLLDRLIEVRVPRGWELEVRVVDNDSGGMAREVVDTFVCQPHAPRIHYEVEPARSIALTRNRTLDVGPADRVVFIDDDEVPEGDWLSELMEVMDRGDIDAVFGPVRARYPENTPAWVSHGGMLDKSAPDGAMHWSGTRTSNTLVAGRWFYERGFRFDDRFGRSGAEDTDLFRRMSESGAKFAGAPNAMVSEDVQPTQLKLGWFLRRHWRGGVNFERLARGSRDSAHPALRFLKRVAVGSIQVLTCSLPALFGRRLTFVRGLNTLSRAGGGLQGWLRPRSLERVAGYTSEGCEPADDSSEPSAPQSRVAFLTNIISPYRAPVFQDLATTPGWNFRVMVNAATEFDRAWDGSCDGVQVTEVKSLAFKHKRVMLEPIRYEQVTTRFVPTGLRGELRRFDPDLVVSVELGPRSMIAASYCARKRKPFVVWSYQSWSSVTSGGWLRSRVRRFILNRAHAVVGMGTQSRQILESYGVPPEDIVDAPNSADQRSIVRRLASKDCRKNAQRLRATLGRGRKIAVVPSRLIPLKGIGEILKAWSDLADEIRDSWTLVFFGGGPLEPLVRQHADIGVQLMDPLPPHEVADLYRMADLHIFPSLGDVWGLVVNEAMLCGTPTLCSVHAACCDDLIDDGVNGFAFDPSDLSGSVQKLSSVLTRMDLTSLGSKAASDGLDYSTDRLASAIREATVLATRRVSGAAATSNS